MPVLGWKGFRFLTLFLIFAKIDVVNVNDNNLHHEPNKSSKPSYPDS
jgi:hypothetical protein